MVGSVLRLLAIIKLIEFLKGFISCCLSLPWLNKAMKSELHACDNTGRCHRMKDVTNLACRPLQNQEEEQMGWLWKILLLAR